MTLRTISFTSIILTVVLFLSFSRGLYQSSASLLISYLLTLVFFSCFSFLIIKKIKINQPTYLVYSTIFLAISFFSLFFSHLNNQSYNIFILFILFFVFVLNVYKYSIFRSVNKIHILNSLLLFFIFLNYLELYHGQLFIGTGLNYFPYSFHSVRPSALTGSYLHYPIIISFLYIYLISNNEKHSMWHIFIIFSILLSYSRSAYLILFIFYILYYLRFPYKLRKIFFIFILILLFLITYQELIEYIRLTFFIEAPGNSGRINTWFNSISRLSFSNFLIGTHFGKYTLMSSKVSGFDINVTESTILSLILNYGIIGCTLFYKLLFDFLKELKFGKIIFIVFFVISLFTQCFETFYMIILFSISRVFIPKIKL